MAETAAAEAQVLHGLADVGRQQVAAGVAQQVRDDAALHGVGEGLPGDGLAVHDVLDDLAHARAEGVDGGADECVDHEQAGLGDELLGGGGAQAAGDGAGHGAGGRRGQARAGQRHDALDGAQDRGLADILERDLFAGGPLVDRHLGDAARCADERREADGRQQPHTGCRQGHDGHGDDDGDEDGEGEGDPGLPRGLDLGGGLAGLGADLAVDARQGLVEVAGQLAGAAAQGAAQVGENGVAVGLEARAGPGDALGALGLRGLRGLTLRLLGAGDGLRRALLHLTHRGHRGAGLGLGLGAGLTDDAGEGLIGALHRLVEGLLQAAEALVAGVLGRVGEGVEARLGGDEGLLEEARIGQLGGLDLLARVGHQGVDLGDDAVEGGADARLGQAGRVGQRLALLGGLGVDRGELGALGGLQLGEAGGAGLLDGREALGHLLLGGGQGARLGGVYLRKRAGVGLVEGGEGLGAALAEALDHLGLGLGEGGGGLLGLLGELGGVGLAHVLGGLHPRLALVGLEVGAVGEVVPPARFGQGLGTVAGGLGAGLGTGLGGGGRTGGAGLIGGGADLLGDLAGHAGHGGLGGGALGGLGGGERLAGLGGGLLDAALGGQVLGLDARAGGGGGLGHLAAGLAKGRRELGAALGDEGGELGLGLGAGLLDQLGHLGFLLNDRGLAGFGCLLEAGEAGLGLLGALGGHGLHACRIDLFDLALVARPGAGDGAGVGGVEHRAFGGLLQHLHRAELGQALGIGHAEDHRTDASGAAAGLGNRGTLGRAALHRGTSGRATRGGGTTGGPGTTHARGRLGGGGGGGLFGLRCAFRCVFGSGGVRGRPFGRSLILRGALGAFTLAFALGAFALALGAFALALGVGLGGLRSVGGLGLRGLGLVGLGGVLGGGVFGGRGVGGGGVGPIVARGGRAFARVAAVAGHGAFALGLGVALRRIGLLGGIGLVRGAGTGGPGERVGPRRAAQLGTTAALGGLGHFGAGCLEGLGFACRRAATRAAAGHAGPEAAAGTHEAAATAEAIELGALALCGVGAGPGLKRVVGAPGQRLRARELLRLHRGAEVGALVLAQLGAVFLGALEAGIDGPTGLQRAFGHESPVP